MSKNDRMVGISRRTLVKSTAIGSLALAAGGFSLPFTLRSAAATVQQASEKVIWGACSVNCGSRCALRLHVKDNEVTWVETDNTGSDEYGNHQVRACLRGRSIRRRINHPDRLNYPMKRVGTRGEGKFERISWDEALDTIASSLKKTVEQYGNEAVYIQYSSGIVGGNMTRSSPSASAVKRLMNCYGGSLNQYGSYSTAQISCAMPYTYGSNDGNSTTDIENSKLVVCSQFAVCLALRPPALADISGFCCANFTRQFDDTVYRDTGNLRSPLRRFRCVIITFTKNIGFIVTIFGCICG